MHKNIDIVFKKYDDSLIKENSIAIYEMLVEVKNSIGNGLVTWNLSKPEIGTPSVRFLFHQFKGIRESVNLPNSDEVQRKIYYRILEKWQYNMSYEILDAIKLCQRFAYEIQKPSTKKIVKQRIENSTEILKINIEEDDLYFSTVNFGEIAIKDPTIFLNQEDGLEKILAEDWINKCHIATEELLKAKPNLIALTFLSPYILSGLFLHSVAYDPEKDLIIDLANNIIASKPEYFRLFNPTIINSLDYNQYKNELLNLKKLFSENDKTYSLVKSAYLKKTKFFDK